MSNTITDTDPQQLVLLGGTKQDLVAFDGVSATLSISGCEFATIVSATTSTLTFTITPIINNVAQKPIALNFAWLDVLMHSIVNDNTMFIVLTCTKPFSPIAQINRAAPDVATALFKPQDEAEDGDDDYDMSDVQPSYELQFTINSAPTVHFDLVFNDTMAMLCETPQLNDTHGEMEIENNIAQQKDILANIESKPIQLIYHLFNQCIRLNPDSIDDNSISDNLMQDAAADRVFNMFMGLEDDMKMFTAEDFIDADHQDGEGDEDNCDVDGYTFVEKDVEFNDEERYTHDKQNDSACDDKMKQ